MSETQSAAHLGKEVEPRTRYTSGFGNREAMRTRHLLKRLTIPLVTLLSTSACFAYGPPFITDDPQPVDFHHWELYIASIGSRYFATWAGTLPHVEVNYGAIPNVQLHLIAPLAFASGPGLPFRSGYGDTELGVKIRFVQESKSVPMVGVFPLLEGKTGNASRGLGTGNDAFYLPVWLQKGVGSWTVYGGGGFWYNPGAGNRDYWWHGVVVQCQTTGKLMLGGEVFHSTSQTAGASDITGFNLGGQYDFDPGHHFMWSVGTGLHGPDHGTFYAAYQWTFGSHWKGG